MNDSVALLLGEIKCWSLLAFEGLTWLEVSILTQNQIYSTYSQGDTISAVVREYILLDVLLCSIAEYSCKLYHILMTSKYKP